MNNTTTLWGQQSGITDGTRPNDPASRQEAVTMINRLYALCTGGEIVDSGIEQAQEPAPLPFTDEELEILHRIVWAEARGEDDKGIILVVNVIINRTNSPSFPNTIRDVIFQPNQFSPITNGAFDRADPCQRIKDLVYRALRGEDYSRGALFFNGTHIRTTSWAGRNREHAFDHGDHSFYF